MRRFFFSTFNDEDEKKPYKKVLVVDLVDRVVGAEKLKKGRRGEEIAKVTSTRVFRWQRKNLYHLGDPLVDEYLLHVDAELPDERDDLLLGDGGDDLDVAEDVPDAVAGGADERVQVVRLRADHHLLHAGHERSAGKGERRFGRGGSKFSNEPDKKA